MLQDAFAASAPTPETVADVTALVARARTLLATCEVGDHEQLFGQFLLDPDRGQTFSPPPRLASVAERTLTGETMLGRFHSGSNSAAHGGAVACCSTTRSAAWSASVTHRPPGPRTCP